MTDDYEKYERACQAIRNDNAALLEAFAGWLRAKGLSEATIRRHCDNIDFYVNEFLLYEEATPAAAGVFEAGWFLGFWFIRKAMWASQTSIRSNAASLKKFYQFMFERDQIDREALDELKTRMKEDLPEWLETMRRYDDPSIEDPADIWGF
jgi:site-specific recombinase XerD